MTAADRPILVVEGLTKSFGGIKALDRVGFAVAGGELLAMIGPNGAGKSTCFNLVGGQLRPEAGRVRLSGEDITGLPPRDIWRRGVGRTFQIAAAFGSMTLAENVQMALISHRRRLGALWPRAAGLYREEALDLLDKVGMRGQAERPCDVLAYGDVKRVELAVALANRPHLLLMDEPTAGMAPAERAALMDLAGRIAREDGIAVLFTEHDMDVVFGHADRVIVLDRGYVIAEGPPAAVRDDARVRAIYLGGASEEPGGAPC
ncbi:MAG: ABC transporter ATP-binding protein [Kiloniellaceae bacterium]